MEYASSAGTRDRPHRSVSLSSMRRLRRYALTDEVLHHRDRARDRKLPVVPELRAVDRSHVGVAVNAQHPGDLARNLLFEFEQRGGEPVELGEAFGLAESDPQPPEEVGTVA